VTISIKSELTVIELFIVGPDMNLRCCRGQQESSSRKM
jgi:hypothetical protein